MGSEEADGECLREDNSNILEESDVSCEHSARLANVRPTLPELSMSLLPAHEYSLQGDLRVTTARAVAYDRHHDNHFP